MNTDFSHIHHYFDRVHEVPAAKILPGEFYVTDEAEVIVTVLGSCVSACIFDTVAGVGGMNHFLLPTDPNHDDNSHASTRYGAHAMEMLINELLKRGARRRDLQVKISGGGHVLSAVNGIKVGERNIEFVRWYLQSEGLRLIAEDVGGIHARKVFFFPETGRMRVLKMTTSHEQPAVASRERKYMDTLTRQPTAGEVELF